MYFKDKVENFNNYFRENINQIQKTIDKNDQKYFEIIQAEISNMIADVGFYLNKENEKYKLEFETLFDNEKKILTAYICQKLEKLNLNNWEFLYYKKFKQESMMFYNKKIKFKDVKILPIIKSNDVKIFFEDSNLYTNLNEEEKFLLTYLMLVSTIGELNIENLINKIEILSKFDKMKYRNYKSISLNNLYKYLLDNNIAVFDEKVLQISASDFKIKKQLKGSTYCLQLVSNKDNKAKEFLKLNNITLTSLKFNDKDNIIKTKLSKILKEDGFSVSLAKSREYEQVDFLVFAQEVNDKINELIEENENIIKEKK